MASGSLACLPASSCTTKPGGFASCGLVACRPWGCSTFALVMLLLCILSQQAHGRVLRQATSPMEPDWIKVRQGVAPAAQLLVKDGQQAGTANTAHVHTYTHTHATSGMGGLQCTTSTCVHSSAPPPPNTVQVTQGMPLVDVPDGRGVGGTWARNAPTIHHARMHTCVHSCPPHPQTQGVPLVDVADGGTLHARAHTL